MRDEFNLIDSDEDTVFRDVIMLALAGFVAIVILLIPFINQDAKKEEEAKAQGNLFVEIRWQDNSPNDVDLWVKAPGDKPVGYSNKNGVYFDLLRDDLGYSPSDPMGLNYESAFSRSAVPGEYIVNLHGYHFEEKVPTLVEVSVSMKRPTDTSARRILNSKVQLRSKEELTVFRFKIDEHGYFDPFSVNRIPHPLRTASK